MIEKILFIREMIACEIVERSHLRLKGFPPVQFHNHLWSFPFLGPWAARKANLRMDTPPQSLRCCIDGLIQLPKITVPPFQAVPWEWEPWRLAKLAQQEWFHFPQHWFVFSFYFFEETQHWFRVFNVGLNPFIYKSSLSLFVWTR